MDVVSVNFNDLAIIQGEDVLDKVMGYEFYFKQSVEKTVKFLGAER